MLYGWLLDKNGHRCEPLTDLSYPVVLLQRGESRGDRFIEGLRSNLYGVLNVSKIPDRNVHVRRTTCKSVTYSPFVRQRAIATLQADLRE